jgi:flagellar basal-body rod modification protein FlgD
MSVSGVFDTPVAAPINTTSSTGGTASTNDVGADQDKFMKLLVTQLKNQDPLNPMDNAAMTSQLAQLSTVTGINKVNETLNSLRADQAATASQAAMNLIGKGVLAAGKGLTLMTDATSKVTTSVFGVDLPTAADKVEVKIQNSLGATVRTLTMTSPDVGTYPLTWDGKMDDGKTVAPDGNYTFTATATVGDKKLTDLTTLSYGAVASVSTGSGGVKLNVPALGQLTMADVKEVL